MRAEPKRARRRRDLTRMKARARRFYPEKVKAAFWGDHLAVCSCWMCGNPRRLGEVTVQEKRALSGLVCS